MERMAVLVNEARHAQQVMGALLAPGAQPAHWVVVMCPPKLPSRIGRWLTPVQRQRQRADWAADLQARLGASLPKCAPDARLEWLLAASPLHELVQLQRLRLGAGLRVLDARRPRLGSVVEPISGSVTADSGRQLALPVAVASALSLMLALTD